MVDHESNSGQDRIWRCGHYLQPQHQAKQTILLRIFAESAVAEQSPAQRPLSKIIASNRKWSSWQGNFGPSGPDCQRLQHLLGNTLENSVVFRGM